MGIDTPPRGNNKVNARATYSSCILREVRRIRHLATLSVLGSS